MFWLHAFSPRALLPLRSPWCITLAEAAAWHRTSCLMEFQEITVMQSISAPGKTDDASWLWQIFGDKHNAKRVEGEKNTIMQVLPAENYQLKSGGNNAKKGEKEEGKVNRRRGCRGNERNREREQSDRVERRETVRLCTTCKWKNSGRKLWCRESGGASHFAYHSKPRRCWCLPGAPSRFFLSDW